MSKHEEQRLAQRGCTFRMKTGIPHAVAVPSSPYSLSARRRRWTLPSGQIFHQPAELREASCRCAARRHDGMTVRSPGATGWQLRGVEGVVRRSAGGKRGGGARNERTLSHARGRRSLGRPPFCTMVASAATKEDFETALALADSMGRSVVVDFTATWCGPCQMMAPHFEALAQEFAGQIDFIKVDVDQNQETAAYCQISAMPTFKVFRGFTEVGAMRGANADGLRQLVMTEIAGAAHQPSRADSSTKQQRPPRDAAAQAQAEQAQKAALATMLGDPANREAAKVCLATILKMIVNVLTSPAESKFRSVKAENKAIKEKILGCPGGGAMLLCAGFERQAEQPLTATPELYVLPSDANLSELANVRQGIETVLAAMGSSS